MIRSVIECDGYENSSRNNVKQREMKKCNDCGELKPLEQYHFINKTKKYRGSYCKKCYKIRNLKATLKWQSNNEERFRIINILPSY